MTNGEEIGKELESISPVVAGLPKGNAFEVPAGYFEGLPASLLARVHEENPSLGGLPKGNVLEAPGKEYFDGLPAVILQRIREEEGELSNGATVIELGRRRRIFSYAAAAVVLGALIVASLTLFNRGTPGIESPGQASKKSSLPQPLDSIGMSDIELITYLDITIDAPAVEAEWSDKGLALLDINDKSLREYLHEIPVEEIEEYIEEYPDPRHVGKHIN